MRVQQQEMEKELRERLVKYGVNADIADRCAKNLTQNSLNGIYSHGLNRFPRLINMIKKGVVKPNNLPSCVQSAGAFEIWDGNGGMGNTNAEQCMARAIELAKQNGIGCVALRNTNHWQRGGAFGIQAANEGCVGICWTNTQPNMPAWGAKDCRIGNNPLVMCIPYKNSYVLVDGAMAQFSYGALEGARLAGRELPVPGGYDKDGNLTTNPAAIEETSRMLPIGYWKGSGFAMVMDMIAAGLSQGNTSSEIDNTTPEDEYGLSQIFFAINMDGNEVKDESIARIIADVKGSEKAENVTEILYPSEREHALTKENQELGIPVNEDIWKQALAL
ncbi:3-dehydro-L-gulonate 2-dehydrogenase [Ruminococcaceae bacterium OttesenSCG-928-A16]|nr:3-dehydro-L-gulonate 2-dehydrogenase [Ruminococcaceae bacterium OttesenSCG-928-A16]